LFLPHRGPVFIFPMGQGVSAWCVAFVSATPGTRFYFSYGSKILNSEYIPCVVFMCLVSSHFNVFFERKIKIEESKNAKLDHSKQ
jgi:hypothetical protein